MAQSTRKELRQPDRFISLSQRAWGYLQNRIGSLVAAGVAAFLVVTGAVVWNHFATRHTGEATRVLGDALETYTKPVIVPVSDGGVSTEEGFSSPKDRCDSVLSSLDRLDKEFGGSDPASAGALVRASCLLDSGDTEKAIKAYRDYLSASDSDDPFRFLAHEGLGYALERTGKLDEALVEFKRMAPEGVPESMSGRDRAMWHEARILELQGKTKEAREAYKEILDKFPATPLRDEIATRSGALGD